MDMDMGGTNMTVSNGMMLASDMAMVFFNSHSTPLYSLGWMPSGAAGYAGTCIFLIFLSVIMRVLMVTKAMMEARWRDQAWRRRYIVVDGKTPLSERLSRDPDAKNGILTANGVEESVKIVHGAVSGVQPWRFSIDLPRAIMVTIMGGIAYLLMIAVMTLNIGYFLSILAGIFIGELAVGRFHHIMEDHH